MGDPGIFVNDNCLEVNILFPSRNQDLLVVIESTAPCFSNNL